MNTFLSKLMLVKETHLTAIEASGEAFLRLVAVLLLSAEQLILLVYASRLLGVLLNAAHRSLVSGWECESSLTGR